VEGVKTDGRCPLKTLSDIADYYSGKLAKHGTTPRGVDWNGMDGQINRFEQLVRLIDLQGAFSVNDLGCGYGALFAYLSERYPNISYRGYDISAAMVAAARQRFANSPEACFLLAAEPDELADYGLASGIFNVRLGCDDRQWGDYVLTTLDTLDRTSRRGFAFNCLTSYSDADRMRGDLYYADPLVLFDRCKRRYARDVALLHDYGLYEFTILVRKQR
jgi:SAM-dependent methyltransferase